MGSVPATSSFILATAGHVDHGKSALVRALTGIDPDRLPEEKARGITIELGFAHLQLSHPNDTMRQFDLGLVDVPGHEDFVKNMVAGVGSIDLALLVVAADDGWMPQTEEHLQILDYLGVNQAIVALTKADLVDDCEPVRQAIRAQLAGSPFASAPIVATALPAGEGLPELRRALADVLAEAAPPPDLGQPRLPIDRVFSLPGAGTIVTGTLTGGVLAAGQSVVVQPSGRLARVRSIQQHGREIAQARPGMRTALNLPDLPLAGESSRLTGVARGQVVTLPELGDASQTLDVELRRSPRGAPFLKQPGRPLKDGARVRVHHGSTNVAARVFLEAPLERGGRALAQLRLEAPLFALAGDRFIVRDWAEQNTLAGGCILDRGRSSSNFRTSQQKRFLQERASHPTDVAIWILSRLERDQICPRTAVATGTRISRDTLAATLEQLLAEGRLIALGPLLVQPDCWQRVRTRAMSFIREYHLAHPERMGPPLTELRNALEPGFTNPEVFEAVLHALATAGFRREGTLIREQTHRPALPAALQMAADRLRTLLAAKPLEPPPPSELASEPSAPPALRYLIDSGEVVSAGPDLVLLASALARARQLVRQYIRKHGPATASELRVALATSRRVIIPLLEQLDRDGLTVRDGDRRSLRATHPSSG